MAGAGAGGGGGPAPVRSAFREGLFAGQVALVTGGGSGIGLRTALELAALGCTVVIAARKMERLRAAAAGAAAALAGVTGAGRVEAVRLDVRDAASRAACVDAALAAHGRIDVLVNNAGGQFPCPAASMSENGWKTVVDLNLHGTFLLAQLVHRRAFVPQRRGVVVNVIAQMWQGFPGMAHTGAARAAVHNLTQTLAVEWAADGVRVLSVAPGTIRSSGLDSYGPGMKPVLEAAAAQNYMHRLGTVEEVAAAIVFLASAAASYMTGTTLRVDGAESLYCPRLPPHAANRALFPAWEDVPGAARL